MRAFLGIACISLTVLLNGCSGSSKDRFGSTTTVPASTAPCPLVTDADLARLNPVLKHAGDDWQAHNGSIFCSISFGVDFTTVSGNNSKPGELLEVSVKRNADFPKERRLPKDLCKNPRYAQVGVCTPQGGIGDYAFYVKTLGPPKVYVFKGTGYHEMQVEGVRAVSGPYEINVYAEFWKGGSPKQGTIELAKKLAAQYR